jgi:isopenicillin N synthase-like dioxygenase
LDVADLEVIKLERLITQDPVETAKLLKAAESQGFFYLTFNDDLSEKVSSHLQTCYLKSHEYFSKPLDEKMKDFRESVDRGYVGLYCWNEPYLQTLTHRQLQTRTRH